VVTAARDGLDLSLPPKWSDRGDSRLTSRCRWSSTSAGRGPRLGYDPEHQLLANRGYAVLAVNYRGSTGLGKDFMNAANKEWAAKMHDDLIDAVNWAVKEKIALKDKVAISGGSYGGYATLVGLTFTPDVFACGVDTVGPSSLVTLLSNPPPYWMPFMPVMALRVGDVKRRMGSNSWSRVRRFGGKSRSLLGQGPTSAGQAGRGDQIVKAMEEKKIPVTYVLFTTKGTALPGRTASLSMQSPRRSWPRTLAGGSSRSAKRSPALT
jgi:hypothetical protein